MSASRATGTSLARHRDVWIFFVLACGITWILDLPLVLAWTQHQPGSAGAMNLTGLGAWGPALAAFALTVRRRPLGEVFGRWRVAPHWIALGLVVPLALHFPATLIEVALGGQPAQWFYPPVKPEHVAALVMFSVGEEFGWRGFAYPRLEQLYGSVLGSLILGLVWALWHMGMLFSPDTGELRLSALIAIAAELPLYSLIMAWFFERSNRSLAVAMAIHAGAHLDNVMRAPETEIRLRILRFLVLGVAAALATRSLAQRSKTSQGQSTVAS